MMLWTARQARLCTCRTAFSAGPEQDRRKAVKLVRLPEHCPRILPRVLGRLPNADLPAGHLALARQLRVIAHWSPGGEAAQQLHAAAGLTAEARTAAAAQGSRTAAAAAWRLSQCRCAGHMGWQRLKGTV